MGSKFTANTGFTLLELMVTLAIIGILVGIGTPAVGVWIDRSKVRSETQRYVGVFNSARVEAISNNQVVTVQATGDAANGFDLDVFVDEVDNGGAAGPGLEARNAGQDRLLLSSTGEAEGLNITAAGVVNMLVSFDENGNLMNPAAVQIRVTDRNNSLLRVVGINRVGRVSVSDM